MVRRSVKSRFWLVLVIFALALFAAGMLWLFATRWAPSRDDFPVQGVSVSSDDGPLDWNTIRARRADFGYIRASSGADVRDPAFADNWAGARQAGLRYGAVHMFNLCRLASDQATLFMSTVPRDNAALPPAVRLDFDDTCLDRPGRDTVLSELNTFLNLIEAHAGKPALVRVSRDFDAIYNVGDGINRTLWLEGNVFPPDYATRPWVMWTASNFRRLDGLDKPVEWDVVRP